MELKLDTRVVTNVEISGVDTKDYPDFCDAYIAYAEFSDGTPLTDSELDELSDLHRDAVHELAHGTFH